MREGGLVIFELPFASAAVWRRRSSREDANSKFIFGSGLTLKFEVPKAELARNLVGARTSDKFSVAGARPDANFQKLQI